MDEGTPWACGSKGDCHHYYVAREQIAALKPRSQSPREEPSTGSEEVFGLGRNSVASRA